MSAATERLAAALAEVIAEAVTQALVTVPTAEPHGDLTVPQLAARFGRQPVTVRAWLTAGRFAGAYRLNGRDWRVPMSAVTVFEEAVRKAVQPVKTLGAWRRPPLHPLSANLTGASRSRRTIKGRRTR
jgi:hypothetical protein